MEDVVTVEVTFDDRLGVYVDLIKTAATDLRYLLVSEMSKIEDTMAHKIADLSISELVKLASDIQRHRALAKSR